MTAAGVVAKLDLHNLDIGSGLYSPPVPLRATDCMSVQMRSLAHSRRRDETVARECISTCSICTESTIGASVEV